MIISHKFKYLFIEIPQTGSTSISEELVKNYYGQNILHKHAHYFEFEKIATKEEKEYFVFAGLRNPLDEIASLYVKFKYNHQSSFTDKKNYLKYGGWISKRKLKRFNFVYEKKTSFKAFLKKLYPVPIPYSNGLDFNKKLCNFIMRFENLNEDFSKVLKILKIPQIRPLQKINITSHKKDYLFYYGQDIIKYAKKIFGPFMIEWGYKFPETWPNYKVSRFSWITYKIMKKIRFFYAILTKNGILRNIRFLKEWIG